MKSYKLLLIVIAVILVLLLMGILPPGVSIMTSVPSGYTGILTTYGKVENTHLQAGLHFKRPFQKVVVMDNHIKTLVIAAGTSDANTKDTAETKDQQLVPTFKFEVQYQLNPEMSYVVYKNYGTKYEGALITSNTLQFIKETFAMFNAEEIVTAKDEIPSILKEKIEAVTVPLGINIIRVNMVTYDFSPEYTALLEQRALLNAQLENNRLEQKNQTIAAQTQYDVAVKEAQKTAETQRIASENANEIQRITAENENQIAIEQAEAKAKTDKINADNQAYITRTQAEAQKEARLAMAEAEKAELEARASGLNDYVIQQQFIERWDGKLIPNFGNTGFGFTDYTDIIKSYLIGDQDDRFEWK